MKQMADIYARIINQYNFEFQRAFSARFVKQDEEDQVLEELELYINLNFNRNLTETDIDHIDVRSQLGSRFRIKSQKIVVADLINLIPWQYISIKFLNWMDQVL